MAIAKRYGYNGICFKKMREAVCYSIDNAQKGDVILFSPGCASFDEFSSYKERGEVFKQIINEKFGCRGEN